MGVERSPISQNTVPRKSRPVSAVIKNMTMADRNDAEITPPSSNVVLSSSPSRRPRK